jgi:hypothetical protein
MLAFIKQHPQEINLGKTDQTWFLDLLLLRGAELHDSAPLHRSEDSGEDQVRWN